MAVRVSVDKGVLQCVCTVGRFFFARGGADMSDKFSISRRRLLQAGAALGGAMLLPGVMQAAWAGGSDKPEQTRVRVPWFLLVGCNR